MATYLITGGFGFIGSHIAELLYSQGHKIKILDNLSSGKKENIDFPITFIQGDIKNIKDVKNAFKDVDGCFHFAAIASVEKSHSEWVNTHQTNLTGTINVFFAASKSSSDPIPVVYASSAAVYGGSQSLPLTEDTITHPLSAYGVDKLGCEFHAKIAGNIHRVPTLGVRMFNVFGPKQDPCSPYSGAVSIFADKALNNQDISIFGTGKQTRDFIYVGDVAKLIVRALGKASTTGPILNICSGQSTSILDLAKLIIEQTQSQSSIHIDAKRLGDIEHSLGSIALLNKVLGEINTTPLKQGIKTLINFLKNSQSSVKKRF